MRTFATIATAGLAAALLAGPVAQAQQAQQIKGADVYHSACMMCHQAQAQGAAGLAPPLKGSYWGELGKLPGYVPGVLLAGMHGPLATDEGQFNGVMPTQNRLSDAEIAAVSNYVVREVNGQAAAPAVAAGDVAALRAKPPTVSELRGMRKKALAK